MRRQRVVETHWVVCAVCGHRERLVTRTRKEFISQCFVCGDAVTNPLVQQLSLAVDGRALTTNARLPANDEAIA